MLTRREKKLSRFMITLQVVLSVFLFIILEFLFPQPEVVKIEHLVFISEIFLIWSILFYKFRLGIIFRATTFWSMIRGYVVTISLAGLILLVQWYWFRINGRFTYSIYYFALFLSVDLVALLALKLAFYYGMNLLRKKGYNSRQVVIIADEAGRSFIDSFIRAKDWGYRIKAIVSPNKNNLTDFAETVIIESQEQLTQFIINHPVDDIFYCIPLDNRCFDVEKLIDDTKELGVSLHILQYLDSENHTNANSVVQFQHRFKTYQTTSKRYYSLKLKDIFDFIFSALIITFLSPLFILIAVVIKIEDGGPVFFKQERIGLNGRRFICHKFRSMVINAESLLDNLQELNESDGPAFKIKNDPRITKVGKLLRKTSLDELPQFYNVLKGEMSVVGPRPPLMREVQQYQRSQLRRLSMRPGITCTWQVSGRNEVSFEEWMQMDLNYIDNWSLTKDLKIIISTIGVILKANGR